MCVSYRNEGHAGLHCQPLAEFDVSFVAATAAVRWRTAAAAAAAAVAAFNCQAVLHTAAGKARQRPDVCHQEVGSLHKQMVGQVAYQPAMVRRGVCAFQQMTVGNAKVHMLQGPRALHWGQLLESLFISWAHLARKHAEANGFQPRLQVFPVGL